MSKGNLVSLLHALSGVSALVAGIMTKGGFLMNSDFLKPIGFSISVAGMLLFAISAIFLRDAFRGNVNPITEHLVCNGPYRFVRHPLYLSMLITIVGLVLGMRSIWGLVITVGVFLPLTVLRAKLEETALHAKFHSEWVEYAAKTWFLIPLIV
jgi:protein-S-isoprenylcysteine O-methyltransferase Ste14